MKSVLEIIGGADLSSQSASITGHYALAWLAGYVVIGAPGGIGIREAMMSMLLVGVMPESVVILGVMTYRIISIIGEIIAFALMYLFNMRRKYKLKGL